MSLHTGKRLHSYEWEELPIDDEVINRVEELAGNQKVMTDKYPQFAWEPGFPIVDNEDEPLKNLPELMNYDDDNDDDEDDDGDDNDDENYNDNEFSVTDNDNTDSASAVDEGSDGLSSGSSDFDNEANESDDDDNLSHKNEFDHPAVSHQLMPMMKHLRYQPHQKQLLN